MPTLFPTDPEDDARFLGLNPPDPCQQCGSRNATELGTLGRVLYVRCRQCGTDRATT